MGNYIMLPNFMPLRIYKYFIYNLAFERVNYFINTLGLNLYPADIFNFVVIKEDINQCGCESNKYVSASVVAVIGNYYYVYNSNHPLSFSKGKTGMIVDEGIYLIFIYNK